MTRKFLRIGYGDVDFAPVLQRLYGLHQVKFLTPFESASWAVLSQRYPAAAASENQQAITEKFGTSLEMNGQRYVAFPEPYRLAYVNEGESRCICQESAETQILDRVAKAFTERDEKFLRRASTTSGKMASQIQGIGDCRQTDSPARPWRMEKIRWRKRLLRPLQRISVEARTLTQSVLDQDGREIWSLEGVLGLLSENRVYEIEILF